MEDWKLVWVIRKRRLYPESPSCQRQSDTENRSFSGKNLKIFSKRQTVRILEMYACTPNRTGIPKGPWVRAMCNTIPSLQRSSDTESEIPVKNLMIFPNATLAYIKSAHTPNRTGTPKGRRVRAYCNTIMRYGLYY